MESTLKNTPVSSFIGCSIIVIFSMYISNAIKSLPCGNNPKDIFLSSFVHVDTFHLFSNLYVLYAISRVERILGSVKFLYLIVFILSLNVIFETILHKISSKIGCSIGFSGILFGIITWELVTDRGLDLYMCLSIMIMVILPSLQFKNVSFSGHLIGAISGVIAGLLFNKISKV